MTAVGEVLGEAGGDHAFRGFVGVGDEVERAGLVPYRAGRQVAEPRQDFRPCGVAQDGGEDGEVGGGHWRGVTSPARAGEVKARSAEGESLPRT